MPKTALCVFATGRYKEFIPQLVESFRANFAPTDECDLVMWTDGPQPDGVAIHYRIPHLKWPYGTLYRYRWITEQARELSAYQYLYMGDVDMRFISRIGPEILGNLVAVVHKGHMGKPSRDLPYCRNKRSRANVPPGTGTRYYAGGFQGGESNAYLKACRKIASNVTHDERMGFIAEWHDEQHWNAYLAGKHVQPVLGPEYCWGEPEGCPPGTKILALAKQHALYRADGITPEMVLGATPEPPPSAPLQGDLVEQVRKSSLAPAAKAKIASLLRQSQYVFDRASPRVHCPGPQGELAAILRQHLPDDPVVYVDVGASEPVDCSNTFAFYQAGGHGLLIEPRPSCWYPILLQRPRDRLWPKAVSPETGIATMAICGNCSSLDLEWTKERRGELMVQTEPLRDILDRFPEVRDRCSLLSVDTEGTEEQVLATVNWEVFRPRIVVVEYFAFERPESDSEQRAASILDAMKPRGYRVVHRDALNLVFRSTP